MTITRSEKPSLVFLNTSFTLRERLIPEMACSTLTRTLEILRLFSFSFSVRSFLRGFFSADTFFVPSAHILESQCPMQGNMLWIRNLFCIGYLFVVCFSWIGLAQVRNSLFLGCGNNDILVTVNLLLAAVVQSLFFRLFWSLTPPFGAVNNRNCCVVLILFAFLEFFWIPFWLISEIIQGLFQNRQQLVDPRVGLGLTHPKQFTHNRLHRVTLLIHQCKQQLLFNAGQRSFSTTARFSLSCFPCHCL